MFKRIYVIKKLLETSFAKKLRGMKNKLFSVGQDLAKLCHLGEILSLYNFLTIYLVLGKYFESTLAKNCAIRQILI